MACTGARSWCKRASIIDEDPNVAQAKAVLKNGLTQQKKNPSKLTVGEAIDRYIESKDSIMSPSTIRGYKKIRKNHMQTIMKTKLSELTQEKIQREINSMAKDKSPKTIRNTHGLLSATIAEYCPEITLHTTLPQKRHYDIAIPSEEDIWVIMQAAKGTSSELPILLAIWLGLRASEIRGITWDCIEGDLIHIKQAIVDGQDGPAIKGTKTFSGDRRIRLPAYLRILIDNQRHTSEFIIPIS